MLEGVSDHSERPNRIHNKALLLSALKSFAPTCAATEENKGPTVLHQLQKCH